LGTDGFADQHNLARTKFGTKLLTELIYEVHPKKMIEQKQVLEGTLDEFMVDTEQRDDILLLGVML
jgi:serine phosphatase RsbU (regulator of sigma subunit)